MIKPVRVAQANNIGALNHEVRGCKVMLDSDLARVYGVLTERLNEQVRRNRERFPDDFTFLLTREEYAALIPQFAGSNKPGRGGRRKLPWVFTEHGAIMAANVLRNPRAVQMSIFVVRAFLRMRAALTDTRELARKLAALERELKGRLDIHEAAIVTVLQRVMDIVEPPALPEPRRRRIGFRQSGK